MCNPACIDFGRKYLTEKDIQGKRVIEVGSYDINGSLRSIIESLKPQSYLGIDIVEGPGVDEICNISDIVTHYGRESFDVVITTELMEHIQDWRIAVSNLKNILTPNGVLLLTTRSKGYQYHGYPFDFWRYEMEDINVLFSDLSIEVVEADPNSPGVFVKAYKPETYSEKNLDDYDLYSIIRCRRCRSISIFDVQLFKVKRTLRSLVSRILPSRFKTILKRAFSMDQRSP